MKKFPKGSPAALAVREKAREFRKHWTTGRSNAAHAVAHAAPVSEKSEKRKGRRAILRARYGAFFADPANQIEIAAHKLEWCVGIHPRLVRDTVLAARRSSQQRHGEQK